MKINGGNNLSLGESGAHEQQEGEQGGGRGVAGGRGGGQSYSLTDGMAGGRETCGHVCLMPALKRLISRGHVNNQYLISTLSISGVGHTPT